jgi:hypothetical protein
MLISSLKPANEIFSFYNYIYNNYKEEKAILYTIPSNPYTNLTVDFFKPLNLTAGKLSPDLLKYNCIYKEGVSNLVLAEGFDKDLAWLPEGKKATLIYQNVPEWLTHFNFNNWMSHSRIWRLYMVK